LTFVGPDRGLERDGRRWSLPEYVEARLPGALADGRVRWLDRRPPAEVEALRRRAAATVMASRYETFAITVTEAMAAACPLAATRAGGAAEPASLLSPGTWPSRQPMSSARRPPPARASRSP
jgi:glycosyltransferase involved in cell wall biosynthesis